MPEVIFPGPEGRLEGRYHPQKTKDAPIAIILHPHPQFGGTMNNRVVYNLHYAFHNMGFNVLRFNFRGVGRSQGEYDQGIGELSAAASALESVPAMKHAKRPRRASEPAKSLWCCPEYVYSTPEPSVPSSRPTAFDM